MKALYEIYVIQNYEKAGRFLSKFFCSDGKFNPAAIFESLVSERKTCRRLNKRFSSFLIFIEYEARYFSDSKYPRSNLAIFVIYALQPIDWCRTRRISRNVALPEIHHDLLFGGNISCESETKKKRRKKEIYIYIYVSIAISSYVAENFVKILFR